MQTQRVLDDYEISTDPHRLNLDVVHGFLSEESYWSRGIPRATLERAIRNSLCFGVYHGAAQVGFARVVTDKTRFALLSDLFIQFLTGLASAASLFLVASGLSIIFGVTRIVNFAHGAFYMLGAYVAFTLTERFSGALGFWGGIIAAALIVAAIGVVVEMLILRRIYHAPELFQLLATFGLTLMVEDLVVLNWGPNDLVGPRAPGLKGALD